MALLLQHPADETERQNQGQCPNQRDCRRAEEVGYVPTMYEGADDQPAKERADKTEHYVLAAAVAPSAGDAAGDSAGYQSGE